MTSKFAIVLAMAFLIHGVHLTIDDNVLKNKYFASNLVFLLSACLMLRQLDVRKYCYSTIYVLLELPLTLIILEASLYYIWHTFQNYIVQQSDDILLYLSEKMYLNWLVCHMCCGKTSCPDIIALLVMKIASFGFLLFACSFIKLSYFKPLEEPKTELMVGGPQSPSVVPNDDVLSNLPVAS